MLFKNLEALRVLQGTRPYSTDKSHVTPLGRSIADSLAVIQHATLQRCLHHKSLCDLHV